MSFHYYLSKIRFSLSFVSIQSIWYYHTILLVLPLS
nr:MAG TPA: hypothetical protein [Bacteriophage sp.]